MKAFKLRLHGWLYTIGWPGVLGVTLAVFAATFYVSGVAPEQATAAELQQTLNISRLKARTPAQEPRTPAASVADGLAAYYRGFPAPDAVPDVLATIYSAAASSNLVLEHGSYKIAREKIPPFSSYEIELPVRGRYPEIQLFVYQVLKSLPALALSDLSIKRAGIGATEVEAKLRFTLYLVKR